MSLSGDRSASAASARLSLICVPRARTDLSPPPTAPPTAKPMPALASKLSSSSPNSFRNSLRSGVVAASAAALTAPSIRAVATMPALAVAPMGIVATLSILSSPAINPPANCPPMLVAVPACAIVRSRSRTFSDRAFSASCLRGNRTLGEISSGYSMPAASSSDMKRPSVSSSGWKF